MPLQGNLKEMSLANLIQVNCQEMRTARLTLAHQGQTAAIFISDGQVVHAENESGRGEEILYRALTWQDGTFTLDTDVAAPSRTIQTTWQTLLLEGMKRATDLPSKVKPELVNSSDTETSPDLLSRLKKIDGVLGVVVASSDGVVLKAEIIDSDGEHEAAVAVFIGGAARQLSESLQLGNLQYGVAYWQNRRVLVFQTSDRFYGLVLGSNGSPILVANAAAQILK